MGKEQTLESLQSFSVSGIHALCGGKATLAGLRLHRLTSAWSRECRPEEDSFANLGLDTSWARYGRQVRTLRRSGVDVQPRGIFPLPPLRTKSGISFWAAMMEAPSSWQMEVYAEKETCALSGGLADYEFGHWRKNIAPGESFATHKAFLTVQRSVLACCNAFVAEQEQGLEVPASEESMPVLFNEYCTTWGCPSAENINAILKAIEPFPIDTFVIDCGWYKPDDKGWCNAIGDWRESRALLPRRHLGSLGRHQGGGQAARHLVRIRSGGQRQRLFLRREQTLKAGRAHHHGQEPPLPRPAPSQSAGVFERAHARVFAEERL